MFIALVHWKCRLWSLIFILYIENKIMTQFVHLMLITKVEKWVTITPNDNEIIILSFYLNTQQLFLEPQ
jgi:hypothetical protein